MDDIEQFGWLYFYINYGKEGKSTASFCLDYIW